MKKILVFLSMSLCFCSVVLSLGLEKLEKRALKELEYLNYPGRENWIPVRTTRLGEKIYNVVIVGGGQTGITLAFALKREKVSDVLIFDENPPYHEGPWLSYARMENLRSPKHLIGPDNDIPSLTVRAWYEAKYGKEAWKKLEVIPRIEWASYLAWLRDFLHLPIVNESKVGQIKWLEEENCFSVPVVIKGVTKEVFTRKIILATGLQGCGEWTVPEHIKKNIPPEFYFHTCACLDFAHFKGKKVGILGGGACAFDSALACCKHGAKEVHMFLRRPKVVDRSLMDWTEFAGFLGHFCDLPDEAKWPFLVKALEVGSSPTPLSLKRAAEQKNIVFHYNSPWLGSRLAHGKPAVMTPYGEEAMDYLIIGTGWVIDLSLREELKLFNDKIALWSDKFTPAKSQQYKSLLRAPYLGRGFNFTEKVPGDAPYLKSIFTLSGGSTVSGGFNSGTISSLRYSAKILVNELVSQLFVEDSEFFYKSLCEQ